MLNRLYRSPSERFFLMGIKPITLSSPKWSKFELMKRNYPYIDKEMFPSLKGETLFFYEEEIKEDMYERYLKPNQHLNKFSPDWNRMIGTVLGYPPKAVEFFSSGDHERFPEKKIFYRFCGVECVGSVDDLVEDVQWLWKHYPYPDKDILTISRDRDIVYMDLEYGDVERAKELQKRAQTYIQKQLMKKQFNDR